VLRAQIKPGSRTRAAIETNGEGLCRSYLEQWLGDQSLAAGNHRDLIERHTISLRFISQFAALFA
jgi:hypothetical protein